MQKIEEMSTPMLSEIASKIWTAMMTIENAEDCDCHEATARYHALQLTYDAIDAELGDREAAAKWHKEYYSC
jgi:hypothetical protein